MKPKKEVPPRRRQPTHYPENHPAWHAAYAAFREVLPKMPEEQAKQCLNYVRKLTESLQRGEGGKVPNSEVLAGWQ